MFFNPNEHIIVIVGKSASGKTTLANQLSQQYPTYNLYHTDDYIPYGWDKSLQYLMRDINSDLNVNKIIEGTQAVRLLRKGVELSTFFADLIIVCQTTVERRIERYKNRGEAKDLTKFDAILHNIWVDYLDKLPQEKKPRVITHET